MNNKIIVAMSGGVDSSAAALLLKDSGYDVTGVTLRLSGNEQDALEAKAVCDIIGIEHLTIDLRQEFVRLVEQPFCESYLAGETPNPRVTCNKQIKFGLLLSKAESLGFSRIATGHYVRKIKYNGYNVLCQASDLKKDQSYMLWQLSEAQIDASVFPLGELTKPEIRAIAAGHGFPNSERHDSQDICFVPDGNYAAFIGKLTGAVPSPGSFTDTEGRIIGQHKGMINYTIGQRKGLGMGFGEPIYVLEKNAAENTVTLGSDSLLFRNEITVRSAVLRPFAELPAHLRVKIRYAHKAEPAEISELGGGRLKITFDSPQRAPAPGQSAVFYQGDMLCGGGIIE